MKQLSVQMILDEVCKAVPAVNDARVRLQGDDAVYFTAQVKGKLTVMLVDQAMMTFLFPWNELGIAKYIVRPGQRLTLGGVVFRIAKVLP